MAGIQRARRNHAFTRVELLVTIAIAILVFGLIHPGPPPRAIMRAERVQCVSNLKQIGIALQLYANDNGGEYPFFTNRVGNGFVWTNFAAAGKQLISPKLLFCPSDDNKWNRPKTVRPVDFSTNEGGYSTATNQENCLSYFYGISSSREKPTTILSGDRNLTANQAAQPDGPDVLPRWSYAGKGPTRGNPGISLGGRSTPPNCGWNSAMHHFAGDILLGDGSVQQTSTPSLVELLAKNDETNNFCLFPINAAGEK